MSTILLTGAAGQVGFELQRALAPLGALHVATRDGRLPGSGICEPLDLEQPDEIIALLNRLQPRVLVNPAAYTAVDRAESESDRALRINADAVDVMARWCRANDALMVHYSTDYVFDGKASTPWIENAPTAPLGAYGRSKLQGEVALRESGARHLILRTAWVYAARGSNFLRTMLRLAAQRDELRVVADQHGAPTPARLIAATTAILLARIQAHPGAAHELGTFHLCSAGQVSWHGIAEAIMQAALSARLLTTAPRVVPISSDEYPTPAARPRYSVLDCARLHDVHGLALPEWQVGLRDVIAELATAGG